MVVLLLVLSGGGEWSCVCSTRIVWGCCGISAGCDAFIEIVRLCGACDIASAIYILLIYWVKSFDQQMN